eukprot:tig00021326_g20286.t1
MDRVRRLCLRSGSLNAENVKTVESSVVTWRCSRCRLLAASNVTVDFRLVSRLAFAVAINYAIHVPSNLSIEGVLIPSSQAEFSVFRGTLPVTVPVSLFPLHFEDVRDGIPRYDAALRPADNRVAEKGEGSFALCSFTKPLSDPECAGESVAFRALFNIDNVYRKVKASIADMLADLSSLAQTAIAIINLSSSSSGSGSGSTAGAGASGPQKPVAETGSPRPPREKADGADTEAVIHL